MKKNTMMRLASFLLIAVLISTSAISGTYAKYVTQDSASDSARVAKWGVELQVAGDLYGLNYKTTENTKTEASTGISVQSNADGKNVVAPGTKNDGTGFTFSLNGKPEVSSKVSAVIKTQNVFLKGGTYGVMVEVKKGVVTSENFNKLNEEGLYIKSGTAYSKAANYDENATYYTLEDYVQFSDDYYPVVYTLTGATASSGTCTEDTLDKAAATIAKAINATASGSKDPNTTITTYTVTSDTYIPNTELTSTVLLGDEKLTWEWAFDNDGCGVDTDGKTAGNFCKADTILGNLQAGTLTNGEVVKVGTEIKAPVAYTDYCLNTQFSIDITVTQVD